MDDREELERLLGEGQRPTPSPDAQWRAEYSKAQYQRRLAGAQFDLFGGPTIEHFHRNTKPPAQEAWPLDYEMTHDLTPEEQAQQLAADPQTPWARTTRKAMTPEEKVEMIASAANWLRLGQRVRITGTSPSIDGSNERRVGRVGVVRRLCSAAFADYVYINLDLVGQERSEKVIFIELRDVVPIED
ncbi:hypothetical protein OIU34_38435 [Pararhizobium sp. BT-229]|uniref:hypothetical protein n=1 Tax=Pararhizobium sp. BT-229 TaxID=2986923 RepID=UPI0021F7BCCD|nr:hypothetical protein [Pararhizobium sp. BT-229]MCV9967703.1 hypothetical protein [Pararhizobium sp. BT-229]